jgi:hypothetical protein
MPGDLRDPRLMYLKAILFLLIAAISSTLLLAEVFSIRNLVLLGLAVWSSCRAYYFLFYVLEHYVDPSLKYVGLWPMLRSIASKWLGLRSKA